MKYHISNESTLLNDETIF